MPRRSRPRAQWWGVAPPRAMVRIALAAAVLLLVGACATQTGGLEDLTLASMPGAAPSPVPRAGTAPVTAFGWPATATCLTRAKGALVLGNLHSWDEVTARLRAAGMPDDADHFNWCASFGITSLSLMPAL